MTPHASSTFATTSDEALAIARDAFVYLYPLVQNYLAIYEFSLDPDGSQYKGPMNRIHNVARVFTPADTAIVTPNSDTPYSYLMMDLRAEPLVVTLPRIEDDRYYSLQLVDLYTHNVDYLGTRRDGNDGGDFLVAGPDWTGEAPQGVRRIVRMPSQLAFSQFRTQLRDPSDLERVKAIQADYVVRPLSEWLGRPAPASPPRIAYPAISRDLILPRFWEYASFLIGYCAPLPGEEALRQRHARIGLAPGIAWPPPGMAQELVETIKAAAIEGYEVLDRDARTLTTSVGLFGTPTAMAGKYRERALGALAGIYGNDVEETVYPSYMVDAEGRPLDAGKHDYKMVFAPGALPPVDAFWSVTMYDGHTRLLVENPLDRYLINSPMADTLTPDDDGSITLYLQQASPGKDLESNWLPAPDGLMGVVLRLYLPRPEVLSGDWTAPEMHPRPRPQPAL